MNNNTWNAVAFSLGDEEAGGDAPIALQLVESHTMVLTHHLSQPVSGTPPPS